MEPFFFGPLDRHLFGVFHPSPVGAGGGTGAVLCHPSGQEYMRSHRAFLQLATRLSVAGIPTLRFDFHACGDSPGSCETGTIERWVDDAGAAVDELAGGCDSSRVYLCGLRLGAVVAAVAARRRTDCGGVVLWDPVVQGRAFLDELRSQHEEWLGGSFAVPRPTPDGGAVERLGFPLGDALICEIEEIDLLELKEPPAERILVVESARRDSTRQLVDRLAGLGADVSYKYEPGPPVWRKLAADEGGEFGDGLVPSQLLNVIVAWVRDGR